MWVSLYYGTEPIGYMHRNGIDEYIVVLILVTILVFIPTKSEETFTYFIILVNICCHFYLEKAITY